MKFLIEAFIIMKFVILSVVAFVLFPVAFSGYIRDAMRSKNGMPIGGGY